MTGLLRFFQISWIVARYRLDQFLPHDHLPFSVKLVLWLSPWRWLIHPSAPPAERLRLAFESLGPVFVKFGQMLSTRRDLLPPDIAVELAKLQDQVPPFPGIQARTMIEKGLGKPIDELYDQFDEQPLASASVAQVHTARLKDGTDVVVKVIRPGILRVIEQDLDLMHQIARLVNRIPDGRRLRPVEVVQEYRKTILDELDLMREGANAVTLKRNFEGSGLLYIPAVYWDYSSRQVLTMERIHGIPIADVDTLEARGVNMKVLAERGVEIFFTQVFRDSFFHADMHPGNIFISDANPELPEYIGVDCGIVGSLSEEDLNYLAQNLLAFFNRDYRRVAQLHVESGWVPPDTRVHEFEGAIRAVLEPIFQKPLAEISFGLVLIRLFQTARRFDMEVQPQLVLLQKTLLNIEGLGRQLYPELDLWQTAKPFLERWLKNRLNPLTTLKTLWQHAPVWLEKAPHIPDMAFNLLQNGQHALIQQQTLTKRLDTLSYELLIQRKARHWQWLTNLGLIGVLLSAWLFHGTPSWTLWLPGGFTAFTLLMSLRR